MNNMNGEKVNKNPFFLHYPDRQIIQLLVCPTTGGRFQLSVSTLDTVDGLKCLLARKLRLHKHKLSLLFKDRLVTFCFLVASFSAHPNKMFCIPI